MTEPQGAEGALGVGEQAQEDFSSVSSVSSTFAHHPAERLVRRGSPRLARRRRSCVIGREAPKVTISPDHLHSIEESAATQLYEFLETDGRQGLRSSIK